eukprot:m.133938 g.133938  ORF g.133938 m.133938 type:complete len:832 (-) comp11370_c0_seq4:81-2576(-)
MAEFTFKKHLRADSSKALIKQHLDAEIKALTIVKDMNAKRAEYEKEYAKRLNKLAASSLTQLKNIEMAATSGIFDACAAHVNQLDTEAAALDQRADKMQSIVVVDVGSIISTKVAVRDTYGRSRDEVDKALAVIKTNGLARKKQYDESAKKVAYCEKKKKSASKSKSMRNVSKKLDDSVKEVVTAHNEYVGALAGNREHIRRYNDELLPNVLETLDSLERFLVDDVKAVLKDLTNTIDMSSDNYADYTSQLQTLHDKVDALSGPKEYTPLCLAGAENTDLVKAPIFEFNDLLSEQANNLNMLEMEATIVTDSIKQSEQDKMEGLTARVEDVSKQIEEEALKLEQCAGPSADLSVPSDDRKEKIKAYTTRREYICKKADLECQVAVLNIKRTMLSEGIANTAVSPDPPAALASRNSEDSMDGLPPALPTAKSSLRSSLSGPSDNKIDASLFDEVWFHGILARVRVSQLLKENLDRQPGDFLVRESTRENNQLVLSVFVKNRISHFKIATDDTGKYKFEGDAFNTVSELVNFYAKSGMVLTHKSGAQIVRGIERSQRPFIHDDITLGERLGWGNFGDVMRGVIVRTGMECAVKTCRETVTNPERFLEEADTLAQYTHPNIVTLYGVVKHHPVMILLELCLGGELLKFLRARNDEIEVGQKVKMCLEAGLGMAYLHSKQCIHRDLAARNCLLTGGNPNVLKISDFGMSRVNEDDEDVYTVQTTAKAIPIRWTAPEALVHLEYHTASDVWSYGILMWEIFSGGKLPYAGFSNSQVKHEVIENEYRLPKVDGCPTKMHDIMTRTWEYEPKVRPTMQAVCHEIAAIKGEFPYSKEVF